MKSYKELSARLVRHYEPPNYRQRLFQKNLSRTQHPNESIVDYFNGNISEELKVGILCKNWAPFYIMQLPDVKTVAQLEEECLKLEVKKYRTEHYVAPKQRIGNSVEPNFAYVNSMSDTFSQNLAVTRIATVPEITCWNCQQEGHRRQQCPFPAKRICFRCGTPGVTVKTCSKCRLLGNGQ